ncbi:hypothetical protein KXJ69_11535 [Aureisphaera sp. CAU 1614]|uniref:Uncharacterized protein n=1 Tax=Halomarinibacterium sedimenti TaxID=2857106 RepID=A0A9X1FRH3_9FLAO|nr:hypothetical protein [Halomarinibacterium sedimenti]MBW2938744.1 hypothetical protein [Halomarinibacterium sedimenti]
MKKSYMLLTLFVAVIFATSCRETYDDYDSGGSPLIGFTLGVEAEIGLSNNPVNLPISYFVTDVSSSDRTFQIIVDPATTVTSDNFSFESSVTIPANERIGQLILTISNVSLSQEFEPIVLSFESTSSVVSGDKATVFVKSNN